MIKIKDYEITINEEKSPLSCYNRLHEYKIGAKEITPEFCKDILSATDNPKVTREIIELIKQKTDKNLVEYAKYRSLLIGSILNRKEQKSVLEKMRDLIDTVNEKNSRLNAEDYLLTSLVYAGLKISLPTYLQNQDIDKRDIKNIENYLLEQKVYQEQTKILQEAQKKATEGKIFNLKQTNNTERGYLGHQNLEDYSKLEINDIKILTIDNCQNIPQANNIDSSKLELLNIEQTDLHGLVLRLPESITDISFKDVTHFSKDIDFSNLQKLWRVLIEQSDLSDTENIFFPQGAEIGLFYIDGKTQLPQNFDLSPFANIVLLELNQDNIEKIKTFPEKVQTLSVRNYHAQQKVLDLSSIKKCEKIEFQNSWLSRLETIKFPQNVQEINFKDCKTMPEQLQLNIEGLKRVALSGETGRNAPLYELILPQDKNIELKIEEQNIKPKIYYGAKPLSPIQKMMSKIKNNFSR